MLREGMWKYITRWTRACVVCATCSTGRAVISLLTPISVSGPFDRVGVDVVQFPPTSHGNWYAVVFMDYLTKWPEVFAAPTNPQILWPSSWLRKLSVDMICQVRSWPSLPVWTDERSGNFVGVSQDQHDGLPSPDRWPCGTI